MNKKLLFWMSMCIAFNSYAANDPVKEYSKSVQQGAAAMQACGEVYGHPYSGVPEILNEKYFRLLKLSGKELRNQTSHQQKIKSYLVEERKLQKTQGDCKTRLFMMKGFVTKMDNDIQALEESRPASKP